MNGIRTAIIVLGLSTAGCTHLQQAPLVYSSKTSVGVDIATTSTETPGIAFNVGYKQVDAAYVPVAVARNCKDEHAPCDSGIKVIKGDSNVTDDAPGVSKSALDAAQELTAAAAAVERTTTAAKDAQDALAALRREELALTAEYEMLAAKYPGALEEATASQALDPAPTAQELAAIKGYARTHETLQGRIHAASANAEARNKDREASLSALRVATDKAGNTTRNDSYSVFGSFSGKADGKATGEAKVGLGKIFATGVASQLISNGLAEAYQKQPAAAEKCYATVATIKTDATSAAMLLKLLEACQQQVSN